MVRAGPCAVTEGTEQRSSGGMVNRGQTEGALKTVRYVARRELQSSGLLCNY